MTVTGSEHPELRIGQRIEELRGARGLTLSQVAARSGLPEDRLRAFEAGREMPAVGDLVRLAGALDASVGHFFQRGSSARRVEVVRAADRFVVEPRSSAARTLNYRYQSLSYTEHSLRAVEGRLVRLVACIAEDRRPHPDDAMGRAYAGH
jgi:transcriptional regulator with XRE-family HTH domain